MEGLGYTFVILCYSSTSKHLVVVIVRHRILDYLDLHVWKGIANPIPSFITAISGCCELLQNTSFTTCPLSYSSPGWETSYTDRTGKSKARWISFPISSLLRYLISNISVCLCVCGGRRGALQWYNLVKEFYYNHTLKKQLIFHSHFGRGYPLLPKGFCCLEYSKQNKVSWNQPRLRPNKRISITRVKMTPCVKIFSKRIH